MVSIDISLFAEILIVIFLMFILNRLLYKPVQTIMNQRRARLDTEQIEFQHMKSACDDVQEDIFEAIRLAREETQKKIQEKVAQTQQNHRNRIQLIREESEKRFHDVRDKIHLDENSAKKELQPEIDSMSRVFLSKILPGIIMCVLFISSPWNVLADSHAESTGEHKESSHEGGISEMARIIDFAIMAGFLAYILRSPVSAALKRRIDSLLSSFEASARKLKDTRIELEEAQKRRKNIESELRKIETDGEIRSSRLLDKLNAEAYAMISKIERDTEMMIASETSDAEQRIRLFTVDQTVENVRSRLSGGIDITLDRKLIERFLDDFSKLYPQQERTLNA